MTQRRPRLVFVSPVFLFPNDAGGKIRTTNVLRGMKGGHFELTLLSPASPAQVATWRDELDGVCDEFVSWTPRTPRPPWRRAFDLWGELPVNVAADRTARGRAAVGRAAGRADVDLLVFDFVHSAVLVPAGPHAPTVCFTHNVEAEIFGRHAAKARDPLRRWIWSSQQRKMSRFEAGALTRFDSVVAVSDRDAAFFREKYGVRHAEAIPTGVDLGFFEWRSPPAVDASTAPTVVFTGSMDWAANIDGVGFFLERVWPRVLSRRPDARFVVVGRNPPASLRAMARSVPGVDFTGFVDDVRPYVHSAHVFVIPLLVGGGTRIKAFEAMAMGCPVVSTGLGMEGLGATPDRHFLQGDDAEGLADGIELLFANAVLRERLSAECRHLVQSCFGHEPVARVFEAICARALRARAPAASAADVSECAG